jgi:mannose-6-phosphate isomerase-like protein (cupin superfamily)
MAGAAPSTAPAQVRLSISEAAQRLESVTGTPRSAALFEHGTLLIKMFGPRGSDTQGPHSRDEIYVIAQGSGTFVNGEVRHEFAPGDVLFVPAGAMHRFEQFSPDFLTWVFFYGPEGGETQPATG